MLSKEAENRITSVSNILLYGELTDIASYSRSLRVCFQSTPNFRFPGEISVISERRMGKKQLTFLGWSIGQDPQGVLNVALYVND